MMFQTQLIAHTEPLDRALLYIMLCPKLFNFFICVNPFMQSIHTWMSVKVN